MSFDLKEESEVKDYIANLGIEYRFGCYHEKNPEACHLLGDYLEAIKKDFVKAAKVYGTNCDEHNFGRSCYKIGKYKLLSKGSTTEKGNTEAALQYFVKGCTLNDPDACLSEGLMLVSPMSDVKLNVIKGMESLKKSCASNNASACYYLSGMFINGVKKPEIMAKEAKNHVHGKSKPDNTKPEDFILHKDMSEAFKFSEMACNLENIYACANLSQMYARGDGVEKNSEMAEKYKKIALEKQRSMVTEEAQIKFQEGLEVK